MRIGYRKAIVFHGLDQDGRSGMDELSTLGVSRLGILKEKKYVLNLTQSKSFQMNNS